jgi:DNA adenine methylase
MVEPFLAPFPWYGGKSRAAPLVWSLLGTCHGYTEPFFGSGACWLLRPEGSHGPVTLNDLDGYVVNFWRAIKQDPELVAYWADQPVMESNLHAAHMLIVQNPLTAKLEGDLDFCDPKIAGLWCCGVSNWIGTGYGTGKGPWRVLDGKLVDRRTTPGTSLPGVLKKLPQLNNPQGVNRGLGLSEDGRGSRLLEWFSRLANKLEGCRITSGDWTRVMTPSTHGDGGGWTHAGTKYHGYLLDPPYGGDHLVDYQPGHDRGVAEKVRGWCQEHGQDPSLRIVLCGYGAEHDSLLSSGWTRHEWEARRAKGQEVLWASPHCCTQAVKPAWDLD